QVVLAGVVAIAVHLAGWPTWLAGVALLGSGYSAALALTEGARRADMAPALDRTFALDAREVRRLRVIMPSAVLAAWLLVVLLISMGDVMWGPLALAAAPVFAAGALRSAYRKPMDWSKPLVMNPFGPPIPPGLFGALSAGPDIVVLLLLPLWLGIAVFGPAP